MEPRKQPRLAAAAVAQGATDGIETPSTRRIVMKKKHGPPPVRDHLPAMFVGDEEPAQRPPIPAEALVTGAPAAAMLPADLRVTVEGTSGSRTPLVVAALLAALFGALAVVKVQDLSVVSLLMAGMYASLAAMSAWFAWGELRDRIGGREEYRLDEVGIVRTVLHGTDPTRVLRIRWTEIADYQVSLDGETLHLRVVSAEGGVFTLEDSPPRLSTREFIRRFIDEAERHPRVPVPEMSSGDKIIGAGFLLLFILGAVADATLDLSEGREDIGFRILLVIGLGLYLWHTLDDDDIAHSDRTSRSPIARLRRWLRRVLGIREI